MLKWKCASLVLAGCAALAWAQVEDSSPFTTIKARAAHQKFQLSVAQARTEYKAALQRAESAYARDLKNVHDTAVKAGNIDETVRLREAMEQVQQGRLPEMIAGYGHQVTVRNGKVYKLVLRKEITRAEAQQACSAMGGTLAIAPDEETLKFLSELSAGLNVWVGGEDVSGAKRQWQWNDGTAIPRSLWAPGQPGRDPAERYVMLFNGRIYDLPDRFDLAMGFICEWKRD